MFRTLFAILTTLSPLAALDLEISPDDAGVLSIHGITLALVVSETGNRPTAQDRSSVKAVGAVKREGGHFELTGSLVPSVAKTPLSLTQKLSNTGSNWVLSYRLEGIGKGVIDVRLAIRMPGKASEGKAVTFKGNAIPLPLEADTYQLFPDGQTPELAVPVKGGDLLFQGEPMTVFLQDRRGKGQDWFEARIQLTRTGEVATGSFTLSLVPTGSAVGSAANVPPPWEKYPKIQVLKDIAYLDGDRAEKMDLYRPDIDPRDRLPAVLVIHGGGWSGGDKDGARERQICETLAKAGFVAATINYLLAKKGEPSWPTNIHDVKTAIKFLKARSARYGIDPDHMGTIGGSAGGHLAMLMAWTGDDPRLESPTFPGVSSKVQAVVDLYGVPDVRLPLSKGTKGCGEGWTGLSAEKEPALFALLSPITHVRGTGAPVFILHGTADTTVPLSQSETLIAALKAAKARHQVRIVPDAPHTFLIEGPKGDFRAEIIQFFKDNL